jgi:hypothetical protein
MWGDLSRVSAMDTAGFWGFLQVFLQQYQAILVACIAVFCTLMGLTLGSFNSLSPFSFPSFGQL